MKKQITTVAIALAFGLFTANAQDLTSKKGEPILPEAGDWGLGVDATPFLNYAGNFFGKTSNNTAPTFKFLTSDLLIVGKYFKDATTAYRAGVRLGMTTDKTIKTTDDRSVPTPTASPSTPGSIPQKENSAKYGNTNIGLTGGIEMRRGKTRLQGYYGGEVGIFFGSSKTTYSYGNSLAPTGSPAVTVNATGDDIDGTNVTTNIIAYGQAGDARITEMKTSGIFQFGVRGFIGVEYFVLPKISLGGEFGWGIGFASKGKTTTTYETQTTNGAGTVPYTQKNGSSFIIDTDNKNSFFGPTGSLRLNFYF